MALSRIKIKDVIKISDERNIRGFDYDFFGININKEFMPSVANTSKVDRRKYKILRKNVLYFLACRQVEIIASGLECMTMTHQF